MFVQRARSEHTSMSALRPSMVLLQLVAMVILVGCERTQPDWPDAAPNAAPAIISVTAGDVELAPYSAATFETGPAAGTLTLTLYDTDLDETLFVSVFVNYNVPAPTPPRSTAHVSDRSVVRTVSVSMEGVCTTAEVGADPLPLLQVYVFDREVIRDLEPPYQGMPPGGLSASQTFFLRCVAAM